MIQYDTDIIIQAGDIDPYVLNHHRTDEPFPVQIAARSEAHRKLIINEAITHDVLRFAEQRV